MGVKIPGLNPQACTRMLFVPRSLMASVFTSLKLALPCSQGLTQLERANKYSVLI